MSKVKKVLLLTHKRPSKNLTEIWQVFNDVVSDKLPKNITFQIAGFEDFYYFVNQREFRTYSPIHNTDLADYDLVIFRILRDDLSIVGWCAEYLASKGVPYVNKRYYLRPTEKFTSELMRFKNGLPVIPTLYAHSSVLKQLINGGLPEPFKFPLIVKDARGRKGRNNYLVRTAEELLNLLDDVKDVSFMIQQFVQSEGDYRFLVMGGVIKLVIHRKAQTDSHLNNISQGASAELVDPQQFSESIRNDVIKAAHIEGLDIAGVDLIIDKTSNQYHILEVNTSPQLASGAFVDQKSQLFVDYVQQLLEHYEKNPHPQPH